MQYLENVITKPEEEYEWLQVLGCLWNVGKPLTEYEKRVLEKAAVFHGDVKLTHCYDGPHRAPPDVMIRRMAKRLLGKDDALSKAEDD